jgi:hypothetical protein
MRPERHRRMIAMACPVMDPKRDQQKLVQRRVNSRLRGLGHSSNRERRYAGACHVDLRG